LATIGELPAFARRGPGGVLDLDFDFVLRDFLMCQEAPEDVSFVEIGAFDGVSDDPLHEYISRFRWRGLLVEPQPRYFQELRDVYAEHEELSFFNGAVDWESGYRTLYLADTEADDTVSWAEQAASFDRAHLIENAVYREDRVREEQVRVEPPMDLLERHDLLDIDIVQIDVEGFDAEVIRMLDFDTIHPHIVQFEHGHLNTSDHIDTVELLTGHGYQITRSGVDTVAYKRP